MKIFIILGALMIGVFACGNDNKTTLDTKDELDNSSSKDPKHRKILPKKPKKPKLSSKQHEQSSDTQEIPLTPEAAEKELDKAIADGDTKKVKELCSRSDVKGFINRKNYVDHAASKGNKEILSLLLACSDLKELPKPSEDVMVYRGGGGWLLSHINNPSIFKQILDSNKVHKDSIDYAIRGFIGRKTGEGPYSTIKRGVSLKDYGMQLKQLLDAKGVSKNSFSERPNIEMAFNTAVWEEDREYITWMQDNGYKPDPTFKDSHRGTNVYQHAVLRGHQDLLGLKGMTLQQVQDSIFQDFQNPNNEVHLKRSLINLASAGKDGDVSFFKAMTKKFPEEILKKYLNIKSESSGKTLLMLGLVNHSFVAELVAYAKKVNVDIFSAQDKHDRNALMLCVKIMNESPEAYTESATHLINGMSLQNTLDLKKKDSEGKTLEDYFQKHIAKGGALGKEAKRMMAYIKTKQQSN